MSLPDDPREPYGRIFHEQGRLTVNAEREKPFHVCPWESRTGEKRELDMRGASAVAVQAVHDAGLECAELRAEVMKWRAHLPLLLGMLRVELVRAPHATAAKPYREALAAFRGSEEEGDTHA